MRRAAALWLLLFAAYVATVGLDAAPGERYGADERAYLDSAKTLAEDGEIDAKAHGVGFQVLIAPAYALGGSKAVELFLAATAALAVALAYRLALRVVPDPWAAGATAAVGLSAPLLGHGTAVDPGRTAAAILVGIGRAHARNPGTPISC